MYVKRNIQQYLTLKLHISCRGMAHIGKGDLVYHFGYLILDYDGPLRSQQRWKITNRQKKINVTKQANEYMQYWLEQRRRPYDVEAIAIIKYYHFFEG